MTTQRKTVVTVEQRDRITGKLLELQRRVRQKGGYSYDPDRLESLLQFLIEGQFPEDPLPVIDFDCRVSLPIGCSINETGQPENRVRGQWTFNPDQLFLWKSEVTDPLDHMDLKGKDFRDALAGQTVFGAQMLDWFLSHPHYIPQSFDGVVFFFGTIYMYRYREAIRCMVQRGNNWEEGDLYTFDTQWDYYSEALILKA